MISLKETDVFITVSQILVKGNTNFIVGIAFDSLFFFHRKTVVVDIHTRFETFIIALT